MENRHTKCIIDGLPFAFIGWKDDHRSFYALDGAKELVIEPELPCVRLARWRESFCFPSRSPIEIVSARLIPPPCRATNKSRDEITRTEESRWYGCWEDIYGEALCPLPEDEEELQKRLETLLVVKRAEMTSKLTRLSKSSLDRRDRLRRRQLIRREYCNCGPFVHVKGGMLFITLAMVKATNVVGIRNQVLHERWARKNGVDLEQMDQEKHRFLQFARQHLESQELDAKTGMLRGKDKLSLGQGGELALLASVRKVMRLFDGQRFYLQGLHIRPLQTAEEMSGFRILRDGIGGGSPPTRDASQPVESAAAAMEIGRKLDVVHQVVVATHREVVASRSEGGDRGRALEKVAGDLEAVAQGTHELRKEKEGLQRLVADGVLKFAVRVDKDDFQAFAFIMALGNRKSAADALRIPSRSFYDRVDKWKNGGPDQQRMFGLVEWRKAVGRKLVDPLPASLQSAEAIDGAENPVTIDAVLTKVMQDEPDSREELLRQIFGALATQNPENCDRVRKELMGLIDEEVPQ